MSDEPPASPSPQVRAWLAHPAAIAAVGGLLLLPWIGRVPLLDLDEPRYADCSRHMLETGDWVYPWHNGRPRHTKPPFFNWVQAPTFALLGVSEFSARLPSVLASVGTGLLLFFFTARLRGRGVAAAALVTWLVLPQTHLWAKMTITDAVLTCLLTGALIAAYRGLERPQGGLGWYVVSGLLMGCATLTKGPVGIVVPAGIYGLYVVLTGSWRRGFGQPGPYVALLAALIVSVPWYAVQVAHYGRGYTDDFFGRHNVERYAKSGGGPGPVGWLWPIPTVLLFAFPVSVLLPRLLIDPLRALRQAREGDMVQRWRLFLAAWVVTNVVLFAPCATRLPHYLMALYPAAAMLIADLLVREAAPAESVPRRSRWIVGAWLLSGLLMAAGFAYAALHAEALAPKAHLPNARLMAGVAWALAAALALAGATCAAAWLRARRGVLLASVWGGCLLVSVAISDVVWPAVGLSRDGPLRTLALSCRNALPPQARLVVYGFDSSAVVYYSHYDSIRLPSKRPSEALRYLAERPGSRLITRESWWPNLPADDLTILRREGQYLLAEPRASAPAAATEPTPAPSPAPPPPGSPTDSDAR